MIMYFYAIILSMINKCVWFVACNVVKLFNGQKWIQLNSMNSVNSVVPVQFKAKRPAAKQEFTLIKHRAKMKYLMCKLHKHTPWNHYLTNDKFTLKYYCSQWHASVVSTSGSVDSSAGKLFDRRHTVKHRQKTLCLPATLKCIVPHWYCNLHILSVFLSCLAHIATILNASTCWSEVCYYFSIRFTIKNLIGLHCTTQAICRDQNTT